MWHTREVTLRLAKRLDTIAPSATLAMNARAIRLREEGHKVFAFAVGEPDFPTPKAITEAAHQAALRGETRYTAVSGTLALRRAICASTEAHRGWRPTPDQVVVSVGAKHALFNLALALYEAGDEVLIPAPFWVSYPEQVRLLDATPVVIPTREEENWLVSPEALERAITPRTKAIVLCSPSNPTGAGYPARRLRQLADVLARSECWIIVDEIYGDLVYDGFAPELRERLVVVDGVSKTYAMTGWRIGWTLSPPSLAKTLEMLQGQSTSNASSVSQAAALAGLQGPRDSLEQMRTAFARRRQLMVEGLRQIPGVSCRMPDGAFYAFANVQGLLGRAHDGEVLATDEELAQFFLDQAHCVTVAGTPFGAPGYLRLSYAVSDEEIVTGLAEMKRAASMLK